MTKVLLDRPNSLVSDAWLNLGDLHNIEVENPLLGRTTDEIDNPGKREISLMRNRAYLSFACKTLLGIDLLPVQAVILEEMWDRPFPMFIASRGFGKSFMLAVYTILKLALIPGTKIVTVGSAFRQSRVIFDYVDSIWKNAPVLRSICDRDSGTRTAIDRCSITINDSQSIYIPLGDGGKIRGLRAHIIIADEFASIPPDVYETVVRGFAAVAAQPIDKVKENARREAMKKLGQWSDENELQFATRRTNQCIVSGTADYDFMHFADYWKKYKVIIGSKGNVDKPVKLPSGEMKTLREYYPDGIDEESVNPKDYSIIRIPYELVPKGFMDDKVVAAAKSGTHKAIYLKEYGAVFPADSDGFFKRSLIQSCVATDTKPIDLPSGRIWFDAAIHGLPNIKYVYGVDPAAEQDNFSVVVLELHQDHTRIVYCWSTNIKDFERRKRAGMVEENDYYGFCARKIRNLMKVFPTEDIAIDAQGGGRAILEAFHDKRKLQPGELFLWPTNRILDPDKELPTDVEAGLHICHMCQFVNFDFTSTANHGTRKDFEDKVLLFPRFDPLSLELAAIKDAETSERLGIDKLYDTLEDCVMEIEELKDELCTITMTRTGTGNNARDRWDTPETLDTEGKKKRLRKDRYSALIMANFVARSILRKPEELDYNVIGGLAHQIDAKNRSKQQRAMVMYEQGPDWFRSGMDLLGNSIAVVKRR